MSKSAHKTRLLPVPSFDSDVQSGKLTVIDQLPHAIVGVDRDGIIQYYNARATAVFGWEPAEILGKSAFETLLPPEYRQSYGTDFHHYVGQTIEMLARTRSGSRVALEVVPASIGQDHQWIGTHLFIRDISGSKHIEAELRGSEERYRLIVETAEEGVWLVDRDVKTVFVNRKMADMLGYTPKEMLGKSVFDFCDEEQSRILQQNVERRYHGIREHHEFKLNRKDGTQIWTFMATNPIYEKDGTYGGALAMVTDITQLKRVWEDLEHSISIQQGIFEANIDGILVTNREGQVLRSNRRFVEQWKLPTGPREVESREDPIGSILYQLKDPQAFLKEVESVRLHPETETFDLLECKDGRVIERYSRPQRMNDRIIGTIWIYRDVTERTRARHFIEETAGRLNTLVNGTPDPIFFKDGEGRWLEVNDAAIRLFKLEGIDYRGKTDAELINLAPTHRDALLRCISTDALAWSTGGPSRVEELIPQPDGTLGTYDTIKVPLFRLDGSRRGLVVIARNITARKKVEQERDRLLVEERTARAEAERAHQEAEKAVRAREEFLSIASHELRTPLTPIRLQIDTLKHLIEEDRLTDFPKANLKRLLAITDQQMTRLTNLVNTLLDISRLSAGKLSLKKERFDLSELVREIVQRFQLELEQTRCSVRLDLASEVIGCWDRLRIDQVVTNLLSNALKYAAGKPVKIRLTRESGKAVLKITDEGIGIPPESLEMIFERFERAVSARNFGGMGLGLYISREIIEMHGGTIRAESKLGEGATFTVELPLSDDQSG